MSISTNYGLISRLADSSRPIPPYKVIRKVIRIASISLLFLLVAAVVAVFIRNGSFTSDHGQALASLCVITGITVFIFGLIAVFMLLWGSFVSTYLINLELVNRDVPEDNDVYGPEFTYALTQIEHELSSMTIADKASCENVIDRIRNICRKYLLLEEFPDKKRV